MVVSSNRTVLSLVLNPLQTFRDKYRVRVLCYFTDKGVQDSKSLPTTGVEASDCGILAELLMTD